MFLTPDHMLLRTSTLSIGNLFPTRCRSVMLDQYYYEFENSGSDSSEYSITDDTRRSYPFEWMA